MYGFRPKGPGNSPKKYARAFIAWVYAKLAAGERVNLPGLGTIHATYRKERNGVGQFAAHQPATYVLKLKPSKNLQRKMKDLAAKPGKFFKNP